MSLSENILGGRLDGVARLWSEARKFVRREKTQGMDRSELPRHRRASWIVECARQLLVLLSQQAVHIKVTLMMTPRGIQTNALEFIKNALAEPLESHVAEVPEDFPI